jgi:hypothetical protein
MPCLSCEGDGAEQFNLCRMCRFSRVGAPSILHAIAPIGPVLQKLDAAMS